MSVPAALRHALYLAGFAVAACMPPAMAVPADFPAPLMLRADPLDAEVARCFRALPNDPAAARSLAQSLLVRPDLSPVLRIRVTVCEGRAAADLGDADAAARQAASAVAALDVAALPEGERLQGYAGAGAIYATIGDAARAQTLFDRAARLAGNSGSVPAQLMALGNLAQLHGDLMNDLPAAADYLRRALELATAGGHAAPDLLYAYGMTLVRMGRCDEAMPMLDRARAIVDMAPPGGAFDNLKARIRSHRARVLHVRHEDRLARQMLEQSLLQQQRMGDRRGEAVTLVYLGRMQLDDGSVAAAKGSGQRALSLAQGGHYYSEQRLALDLLSDAAVELGQAHEALDYERRKHRLEVSNLENQNLHSVASLQSLLLRDAGEIARRNGRNVRDATIGVLVLLLLFGAGIAWLQARTNRRLRKLGMVDALTGLLDRREATRLLEDSSLRRDVGDATQGVLFLTDVDRFRQLREQHGQEAGDDVLRGIAGALRSLAVDGDVVARWGGDEFLFVRPSCSREQALQLCARLADMATAMPAPAAAPAASWDVSVCSGFAPMPFFPARDDIDWRDSFRLADHALRIAKRAGTGSVIGLWGAGAGRDMPLSTLDADLDRAQAEGWIDFLGRDAGAVGSARRSVAS